jgi:hypothetical protein
MSGERFIVSIGPDGTRECLDYNAPRVGYARSGPRELAAVFLSWDGAERAIREIQKSESLRRDRL